MDVVVIVIVVVALLTLVIGVPLFVRGRSSRGDIDPVARGGLAAPPRPARGVPPAGSAPSDAVIDESDTIPTDRSATPVDADRTDTETSVDELEAMLEAPPAPVEAPSLRDRLGRARATISEYLGSVLGRSAVDEETWEELEEALILADCGMGVATELVEATRQRAKADAVDDPDIVVSLLADEMRERLSGDRTLAITPGATNVWLFVGVNGVGKTTTIGKVAQRAATEGHTVLMAAGDTFRAAAAEQLGAWAERTGADLVRGGEGADPGSVVFDGVQAAAARGADLVLADTAGRLHTKTNLMDELSKVRRIADRDPGQVTEVLLVIDATTGQNGLTQAAQFAEATDVTGVVLTKLDGSAKGGIVFAIETQLGIPVKLIGVGEGVADLVPFDPREFVDALLSAD